VNDRLRTITGGGYARILVFGLLWLAMDFGGADRRGGYCDTHGVPFKLTFSDGQGVCSDGAGFECSQSTRDNGIGLLAPRGSPKDERQFAFIVDVRKGFRTTIGTDAARTPTKNAALKFIKTRSYQALVVERAFLDMHVHLAVPSEGERTDVEVAADEFERESVARN